MCPNTLDLEIRSFEGGPGVDSCTCTATLLYTSYLWLSLYRFIINCTAHSGAKKAHDWAVGQLPDLFRTTHTTKTQQVVRIRGQHCGDVELVGYLVNAEGPVSLVLDLRLGHDRFGSSSDPTLNGTLHYPNPNDIDRSLNESASDKIRKYRTD